MGRDTWQRELEWVRRAVESIGHKNAAYALDIAPSTLSDALAERTSSDGTKKSIKAEWLRVLVTMSSDGMRQEWLRIVSTPLGFEPERIKYLDAAEELRLTREALRRHAPTILREIDKEIGR